MSGSAESALPQEGSDFQIVAQGAFKQLREMQLVLQKEGFPAEVVEPPEGCGSG